MAEADITDETFRVDNKNWPVKNRDSLRESVCERASEIDIMCVCVRECVRESVLESKMEKERGGRKGEWKKLAANY